MIRCEWREKRRMLVSIDGQVYPCCYLANNNFQNEEHMSKQPVMKSYMDCKDEMNIKLHDITDINNHQWWTELEESWSDPSRTLRQCKNWCTVEEKDSV